MTITQRQNANIAAAKLLGRELNHLNDIKCEHERLLVTKMQSLDIFTNPADCLAVVKMLGEKHHTSVIVSVDCKFPGWGYYSRQEDVFLKPFNTYEEAVAAACLEIGGKDEN